METFLNNADRPDARPNQRLDCASDSVLDETDSQTLEQAAEVDLAHP